MTRNYHRPNRDANHGEISRAFERMGCTVRDLSMVGGDCPDILIGMRGGEFGVNVLVEIKTGRGKLSDGQRRFFADWRGPVEEARGVDDVEAIVRKYRRCAGQREGRI